MKKNVDNLVQELIALDPSFAMHEKELRMLIGELLENKPDTRLDEEFVTRLRARLLGAPVPSPFGSFFVAPYAVIGVLAVLLIVPFGFYAASRTPDTPVFAMTQDIRTLQGQAFGTLNAQDAGKGGGGADMATDQSKMAASSPYGAGDMMGSSMMVPEGPVTVFTYVYKGEPSELTETEGAVYRRMPGENSSGQVASQLKKFNFGLVNLGAFADMRVRSFELVEDKPYGYSISASFDEGIISINPNYTQWPSLNGKEMPAQLPGSAIPSDEEVIAMASRFLDDHNISLANYSEPVVQTYAPMGITETRMQYAPEQITVTYPLKINGASVYENGEQPHGLQVSVSVRDKRVMSVYGLSSQTYTSSSYTLSTDADKILSIANRGGVNVWVPEASSGIQIKKVEAELGTPEKILMHTYTYTDGESKELFVPALRFPVTKAPDGELYYPKSIVIPLVPELLTQEQIVMPMDAVR
jgi:hypothetical protein